MTIAVREFVPADYDAVVAVWRAAEGVVLHDVFDESAQPPRLVAAVYDQWEG